MRISHAHKFVFLSKWKCASEAVRAALDPFSDIVSTQEYPWYHHTPLAPLKREFAERGWDWDSYFVFTTVRNPYTMLNSLYAYAKPDTGGLMWWERFWDEVVEERYPSLERRVPADPVSFEEWVLTHDLSRFTLDAFTKDDGGQVCTDAVLRVEALKEEFEAVVARLGLVPPPSLSVTNMGNTYDAQPFDRAMCDRIQEVFRTDFEVGGYPPEPPQVRERHHPAWLRRAQAQDLTLPTISIVTPSFNRKYFLAEAMSSVLGQGYPKLEYVVVDGGSTDGSAELIATRADELAWSVSEPDSGAWDAINKGFAHTSGEVMGWLGSDDLLMPWTLSLVGELFAEFPEVEWLTTGFPLVCDEDGRAVTCGMRETFTAGKFFSGENLPEAGWEAGDFIMQEGTFWRRSLWERAGGRLDESLKLAADFELWARFFRAGAELHWVGTPLASFRLHGNQKSQVERAAYIEEARDVFIRYGGTPPSGETPLLLRLARRVLPLSVRKRLGQAIERFLSLPGSAQQGPMILHLGPTRGWSIRHPDETSDGERDLTD